MAGTHHSQKPHSKHIGAAGKAIVPIQPPRRNRLGPRKEGQDGSPPHDDQATFLGVRHERRTPHRRQPGHPGTIGEVTVEAGVGGSWGTVCRLVRPARRSDKGPNVIAPACQRPFERPSAAPRLEP
jgi:hypothetical protein